MSKKIRAIILVVTLLVGVIGTSTVAMAGQSFGNKNVSTTWTTVASDTEGMGYNVELLGYVTTVGAKIHVRMLGKSNNVLWTEMNSMGGQQNRVYRCGSDVYKVQVKVDKGVRGSVSAVQTSKPAN